MPHLQRQVQQSHGAMSMGLWLARTGGGGRSEKQCVLLIIVFLCACASPVACAFLRPFGVAARTLRAAGPRRSLLRGGACSSRRAPATVLKKVHMSCTVLVVASQGNIRPMVSHSFDTAGGVDFRLVKVPAKTAPPNSLRPVFLYEENALPRFAGDLRGAIPEYTTQDVPPSQPLGFIPEVAETFSYWEAASGICNEKGVMIAECTCSSIFGAEPLPKGKALLGYMELTRIALERCSSALDAVELIGSLAERHGFYGNTPSLTGAAESLAIADKHEAWVLHVLPDDTGASAIWAAARVPDGHAAAVTNMFVIRNVDLDDPYNFRYSASMLQVAARLSLWRPGTPLDFTKVYSHGEARHKFYSGRRLWRALSLLDPSQHLPQDYDDLVLRPSYPFAVKPAEPVTSKQLRAIMRDYFQGTPLDLARGAASGPFGIIDRFDGAKACMQPGAPYAAPFERPIGVYRMAYSYICEGFLGEGDTVIWFAPHASVTAVYLPVLSGTARAPDGLACGSIKKIDRACAYWAFRYVKHMALMLFSRYTPLYVYSCVYEVHAHTPLYPIPYTLHPTPYALHPTPYTLLNTLHLTPYTRIQSEP
jgi:dipeptidase